MRNSSALRFGEAYIRDFTIICFAFLSFLHIEMAQVVEILPHGRQGPTYLARQ